MKSSAIVLICMLLSPVASAGDLPPLAFTGKPATLPPQVFADGSRGPKLPPSPFADGSWGLKLPRAVLIAKEPPDQLPKRLLAYSPDDEIQEILFLGEDGPVILRTESSSTAGDSGSPGANSSISSIATSTATTTAM